MAINIEKRNEKIVALRLKSKAYSEIAERIGLSTARVRQICVANMSKRALKSIQAPRRPSAA